MQALQAGLMTALAECAPVAFTFKSSDRVRITTTLHHLTRLTTHLTVARQVSAELERLENTLSVEGRFSGSTPDVKEAWKTFYEAILARREILAQMHVLNSTPMSCDNVGGVELDVHHLQVPMPALKLQCFRFNERASFKKCAGCGMAHYCSKDCQARAWKEKGHRSECKTLKAKPG